MRVNGGKLGPRDSAWLLLGVLALIWGSSFILMKRGLFDHGRPVFDPVQVACLRLALAWTVLSPLLFRHAVLLPQHWRALMVSGLVGNGIPAILFTLAQTRVGSAVTGVLNSLSPLFTLLVGALFFRTRVRPVHALGILLGLAGAAGLMLIGQRMENVPVGFASLAVVATLCYGISANVVKHRLAGLPPEGITVLALTFVGPLAWAGVFLSGAPAVALHDPAGLEALLHVVALAAFGTALAVVLWNRLIQLTSALAASTVTYLMPVVAIAWGMLDGETFGWAHLGMVAAILSGVLLVHAADRYSR
jgi:drug/metabolite transporter (DMT)-like permease